MSEIIIILYIKKNWYLPLHMEFFTIHLIIALLTIVSIVLKLNQMINQFVSTKSDSEQR